jgi:hypothetical protein
MRNLRIPTKIDREDFEIAGYQMARSNGDWTDGELVRQIAALSCVTSYLKGRKDFGVIYRSLRVELDRLEEFRSARGRINWVS